MPRHQVQFVPECVVMVGDYVCVVMVGDYVCVVMVEDYSVCGDCRRLQCGW